MKQESSEVFQELLVNFQMYSPYIVLNLLATSVA